MVNQIDRNIQNEVDEDVNWVCMYVYIYVNIE